MSRKEQVLKELKAVQDKRHLTYFEVCLKQVLEGKIDPRMSPLGAYILEIDQLEQSHEG